MKTPPFQLSDENTEAPLRKQRRVIVLAVLAFLLSGVPRLNISIGFPLYAVDLCILYLLLKSKPVSFSQYRGHPQTIVKLISCYLLFAILGELHGGLVYGRPFESIYMLVRSCLAISIAYIIPQQIRTFEELRFTLKGICLGLFLSGCIAILYSMPATRGLTDVVFSLKAIVPNSDSIVGVANIAYDQNFDGSYRGLTLIGTSTFSSGAMATLWPLIFMMGVPSKLTGFWQRLHKVALIVVPLGILATYGRSAWLSVVLVGASSMLWGSNRVRTRLVFFFLLASLAFGQWGFESISANLPLVDRVVSKTQIVIEHGATRESEAERFLAYVEPFSHITKYPSFAFAGSGIAQRRWGGNFYGEAETASHAIPGIAYYTYGAGGAICQVGLMLLTIMTAYKRLSLAQKHLPGAIWVWRSLLACWFGLLPWWCFGHGIVTEPRGAGIFFFFIGVVLACDRLSTTAYAQEILKQSALLRSN